MVLLDLMGRRGTLRIVWELRDGALTFRALQEAAELTPSTLNTRLKELREARIVSLEEGGYALTPEGQDLRTGLRFLYDWAEDWAARGTS
jgi:DNA-binding HxlR family transcriptional regulator